MSAAGKPSELELLDAWWRAANYLAVGQIYLMDNPLLRRPLTADDIKPRLLGHWGTTPGLSFVWAHLDRVLARDGTDALFVAGAGCRDHTRRYGEDPADITDWVWPG